MGAHEIPLDYRARRDDYVRLVIDEMIPAVAANGLAEWCDVFCETGVFTPDESRAILQAGAARGLKPRIHADELGASGGSQVAAVVGARSADHLIFVPEDGIRAHARRRRRRDAAAQCGVLPEARTIRAGAGADRRRRRRSRSRPTSIPAAASRRRCRSR